VGADDEDLEEIRAWLGTGDDQDSQQATAPSTAEVVAAARRFHRRLRTTLIFALEDAGVSYAQFEILVTLEADPSHHAASIAHQLGSSRQAVSRLVGKLVDGGYLQRLSFDNGVQGLRITELGRQLLARCEGALSGFHSLFGRLEGERRVALIDALRSAETALRR
jgi:DNA-binding MarR family transcriptional regulator